MWTYSISEATIWIYSLKQKPSIVYITPLQKNRRLAFTQSYSCRDCAFAEIEAGLLGLSPLMLLNFYLVLPPGGNAGRRSVGFTKAHLYNTTLNYTAFLI